MPEDEKKRIEAQALAIPTNLFETCHTNILKIKEFLPHCNPNITSDAKVGVHQLAGAARAAYQASKIDCIQVLNLVINNFIIGRLSCNTYSLRSYLDCTGQFAKGGRKNEIAKNAERNS